MNRTALTQVIVGVLIVAVSWPLTKRKIGRNCWYSIRIREAFESETRWYDINAYGGRLFLRWGVAVTVVGLVGLALPRSLWFPYIWVSLVVIIGGLVAVIRAIRRYAGGSKRP